MAAKRLNSVDVFRFAIACILTSTAAAVSVVIFRDVRILLGPAIGIGITAAYIASGVAGWFSFRARDRMFTSAAIASVFPFLFWNWIIYCLVHFDANKPLWPIS